MDFARSVAHLSILNPGAPTGCTDNTLGGSDISNLGKKCPLCAVNATGRQITVKSIQGFCAHCRNCSYGELSGLKQLIFRPIFEVFQANTSCFSAK